MAKNIDLNVRLKGAKKAEKGLGGVDNKMKSLGKSAMAAAGGFFAARGIINAIKSVVALEREQTLAVKKLETALGKNSKALQEQASALQQVTTFGDETIIQAQAMLAMFIKDEEQLKKATIATLDLAAAKGMDLVQAADLVGKSVGSSTNALARYGVSAEGAAGSTERLDSIVGGMTKFFGGQATAIVDTMAGSIDQMNNAIGDVGEDIGELLAPAITKAADAVKEIAESINLKTMQDFARGVAGITIAFAAYNSAALLAKVRTIQFQATLVKTGWGALIVGAGLAIGKMLELAGVFSTTEGEIAGLNDEMKELSERSFLQLDATEQVEKVKSTKKELLSMFEEGELGSANFQAFIKASAIEINKMGMTASEVEEKMAIAVEKGIVKRIGAKSEENAEYDAFVQKQRESVAQSEKESEWIEKLKEQYPELAEAMGLVNNETDDANKGWELFQDNLNQAAAASILTASSITSTSDALGAAEEAAKRAATAFISAEIQKAVSKWIASMLETSGPLAWLTAPLALAGGAAFGSAMGSAIERISFAQGGDFVTSGPQAIIVGDNPGGRERVQVEPLSSPNISGPKGGITLNISAPLVDDTVIDTIIPAIEKAQRNNLA